LLGLAYLIMVVAANLVVAGERTSALYLMFTYLFFTPITCWASANQSGTVV
jgi:hypothetical protein